MKPKIQPKYPPTEYSCSYTRVPQTCTWNYTWNLQGFRDHKLAVITIIKISGYLDKPDPCEFAIWCHR